MEKDFSYKASLGMRGFAVIFVILYHLSEFVPFLSAFERMVGIVSVGLFLFCSGYGLAAQYQKHGAQYAKKLISVRIPYIIIAYALANIVYLIVRLCTGTLEAVSVSEFLFGGGGLVKYSWYIICIVYLYFAFFLSYGVLKKKYLIYLFVALWIGVLWMSSGGLYRFVSTPCFALGIVVAEMPKIKAFMLNIKCGIVLLPVSAALYIFCAKMPLGRTPLKMVLCFLVPILISAAAACFFSLLEKYRFFSVPVFLGKLSLEMYLYQGAAIIVFTKLLSDSQYLLAAAVVITTFLFALVMEPFDRAALKMWQKLPFVG